jgi:hypothetical protein
MAAHDPPEAILLHWPAIFHGLCGPDPARIDLAAWVMRELVLHENDIAIYRVGGDAVEILRLHHVARNL